MTIIATLLLQLLFGFGHPAPVVFHQETQPFDGAVIQCSQYGACVPLTGNTSEPHTLPGEEGLP